MIEDETRKVSDHPVISFGYSTWHTGLFAWLSNGMTIALVWGLCSSYPDTLYGPTWLMALVCYAPFVFATLSNLNSYTQIYLGTFVVMMGVWMIIPVMVGLSFLYGLPFIFGFTLVISGCLHLWSVVLSGRVDLRLIARLVFLFMTTAFVASSVYGILISVAIQFYRAPFLLQPISVFGFSSLESVVIFINCLIAWTVYLLMHERSADLISGSVARNPLIILAITISIWCCLSGIIWGSVSTVATISVATMNSDTIHPVHMEFLRAHKTGFNMTDSMKDFGKSIPIVASRMSPDKPIDMIVLPEFSLYDHPDYPCEFIVSSYIAPETRGMNSMITIGCAGYERNMALTFYSENPTELVSVYGKMKPTPGEVSDFRPGYSTFEIPSHMIKWRNGVTTYPLHASPVICYDMDYTDTISQSVDLGASVIVNPASDWNEVRHHFAAVVIRAVENRVPIVKAENNYDAVIVDPFGQVLASGKSPSTNSLFVNQLPISTPLKINYPRQLFAAISSVIILAGLIGLDIYCLIQPNKLQ